jgi:hypothetical protein
VNLNEKYDATFKLYIKQATGKVEITGNDVSVSNTRMFYINTSVSGTNVNIYDNTFSVIGKALANTGMSAALAYDNNTAA